MTLAAYDAITDHYAAFVATSLDDPTSVLAVATESLLSLVGEVAKLVVCDLGCGEGHLARRLTERGGTVVGVDVSASLLALARRRTTGPNPRFVRDDGQGLASFDDHCFDLVISNLVLMDVSDLAAVHRAVARTLRPGGRFVFSITHPCFQAPAADDDVDDHGRIVARRVPRYASEGFWRSSNLSGIRGQVGAFHRTLATYLNTLVASGLIVEYVAEPVRPPIGTASPSTQRVVEIPSILVVAARRPPEVTTGTLRPYSRQSLIGDSWPDSTETDRGQLERGDLAEEQGERQQLSGGRGERHWYKPVRVG